VPPAWPDAFAAHEPARASSSMVRPPHRGPCGASPSCQLVSRGRERISSLISGQSRVNRRRHPSGRWVPRPSTNTDLEKIISREARRHARWWSTGVGHTAASKSTALHAHRLGFNVALAIDSMTGHELPTLTTTASRGSFQGGGETGHHSRQRIIDLSSKPPRRREKERLTWHGFTIPPLLRPAAPFLNQRRPASSSRRHGAAPFSKLRFAKALPPG